MTAPTKTGQATKLPRQRRPRGRAPAQPVDIVQPPEKWAHLSHNALYLALTSDGEEWDSERFAAEAGRSLGRFRVWVSKRYAVDAWAKREPGAYEIYEDDRTAPAPHTRYGQAPVWYAGVARKWLMQVGLMDHRGVFIPFVPAGRVTGALDIDRRARRPMPVREISPTVLAEYRALRAAGTKGSDAKAELAAKYAIGVRQVERRLEIGREVEREQNPPAVDVDAAELVGADG